MARYISDLKKIFFTSNGAPEDPGHKDIEENQKHFQLFVKLFGRKAKGEVSGMPCRVEFIAKPYNDSLYQIFIHLGWMHHHMREQFSYSYWRKLINELSKREKKGLWCASFIIEKHQSHIVISVKSYALIPDRFL